MKFKIAIISIVVSSVCVSLQGQSNSGTVKGTVLDPSGAAIKGATVEVQNPVSRYIRASQTDDQGKFQFTNVPYNNYHLTATSSGFQTGVQEVDVRSSVPVDVKIALQLGTAKTEVTVTEGQDLVENDPVNHTDVDRALFDKLPLESPSSSVSSLVTLASPGVAADSNGLFHGLGDHAQNSFSVDGQPITDQQSKVFSNQIPVDSVQSIEVLEGAPPAEFGGKTSLVIVATTRSGQGVTTPHGDFGASYGTFGTSGGNFNLAYGGKSWGNFIAVSGLNTGRFLDPPEFTVMHDKGNEENLFDRIDYQFSAADSVHLDLGYTRSWFQNPNSFDQEYHPGIVNPITGGPLGPTDQRSKIKTLNVAPAWTRVISPSLVFTLGAFMRTDEYNYYPSADPFADWSPDLQSETVTQGRRLNNVGVRSTISYVKGIHNLKAGATYEHTFLTENDSFAIVDPTLIPGIAPSCLGANGQPIPGTPCAILAPNDLATGGTPFRFFGHTDIKELALFVQDTITKGSWTFNAGIRGDLYNGIVAARQAEPRLGIAYNIKPSNTVLQISYARTLETPFNENLIIASTGCSIPFLAALVPPPGVTCNLGPIHPGWRNEFHAGLQQAFGRYLVFNAEYIWKYTHNAFDFGVVGATPITFPIEWHSSKIPGYAIRVSVPDLHGLTAFVTMSGVAARFFLPQVAGLPIIPVGNEVFRIDHDELFNETTHFQYQPWKRGPWLSFNWRYDSGLVAGAVPCVAPTATCALATSVADGGANPTIPSGQVALVNAISGLPLTADQEFQAGLTCDGKLAAPNPLGPALATCDAAGLKSIYINVPPPGTENDDHKPQRIASRNLFDLALGHDNIFHGDRYKWSARVEVINLTDKVALYNFLSTFSGTHYVTPRTITGTVGFHF
ncbi:MAG: TonB-dependent receptor [Acidobacteriaceae bacterium]|nr:TonB-dependent receptor [Acidobacteriaceae bacterium]MBV9779116.1 TonB-dependent receptor [Acidobacteriaceae bacterium]